MNDKELRDGLHQFTMHFYNEYSKLYGPSASKLMVIKVFEDEVKFITSSDESLKSDNTDKTEYIKAKIKEYEKLIKKETDETKRYNYVEKVRILQSALEVL